MNQSLATMLVSAAPAAVALLPTDLTPHAAMWSKLIDTGSDLAANLAVAMLILLMTIWIGRWTQRLVRSLIGKMHTRTGVTDPTLQIFIASLARNTVFVLGGLAVLQQLGVKTTSIVAAISAAALAIGLAMQGALSNVAAGLMILIFRPYRVGDIIETGGRTGRVRSLDLFLTEIVTLDNLKVVAPNSKVFGDVMVDHTYYDRRRADAIFRLPPGVQAHTIMERLRARLKSDPRVLKSPEPLLEITNLTETFVEIAVRPWTSADNYGPVKADVLLWADVLGADPKAELPGAPAPRVLATSS